jgi:hypothetical protein
MWYTGIDWADDHHDAAVIDEAGHQLASLHVTHTRSVTEPTDQLSPRHHWT